MYNLIFLLFVLTTPLSLLPMNNKDQRALYFQQLDNKKDWSNSLSETFCFIDNFAHATLPKDIKTIIKNDFIILTKDEINLWDDKRFNDWNIPITTSDFVNLNKNDKRIIFELRHANRHNEESHYSIGAIWHSPTRYGKREKLCLTFENKYYALLQKLSLHVRKKITAHEGSFVLTKENTKNDSRLIPNSNMETAKKGAFTGAYVISPLILKIVGNSDLSIVGKSGLSGIILLSGAFIGSIVKVKYFPEPLENHYIKYCDYAKKFIVPEENLNL